MGQFYGHSRTAYGHLVVIGKLVQLVFNYTVNEDADAPDL